MKKASTGTSVLEFVYDYMSRRVEKKLTQNGTVTKHERFVYDNYKCIEKLDILNGGLASQKYAWRGDELLCMSDAAGTYAYFADANKNIGQLINISTGAISSKYEYSPYGQLTSSDDTLSNPFRFSSEYYEEETGLVYYNYRYYSPSLGRWLSRDPIEEEGGLNLYGIVDNNVINVIDLLGEGEGWTKAKSIMKADLNASFKPSADFGKMSKVPAKRLMTGAGVAGTVVAQGGVAYNYHQCLKKAESELDSQLQSCMNLCPKTARDKCISNSHRIHTLSAGICATEYARDALIALSGIGLFFGK